MRLDDLHEQAQARLLGCVMIVARDSLRALRKTDEFLSRLPMSGLTLADEEVLMKRSVAADPFLEGIQGRMARMQSLTSYDEDYAAWSHEQAELIRLRRFDLLDVENLAEEIEDLGKKEKRELESRLKVLICHLLKMQLQPQRNGTSWALTVRNQREDVSDHLAENPSLRGTLEDDEKVAKIWRRAVEQASKETELDASAFPMEPCWTMTQLLDPEFFPNANDDLRYT